MTATPKKQIKKPREPRENIRFEREAKALQKNLEKRKKQQQAREEARQKAAVNED